ncbi:MAG: hypothetical protein EA344_09240 [Alkalicoccus sp.]|nr:MAG: hypothetical protein EA344_09240 [Alkalicoccus sp.]
MVDNYIAAHSFLFPIGGSSHSGEVQISRGDIVSIYKDQMYKRADEWYVPVEVNQRSFNMNMEDLKHYCSEHALLTEIDIELQLNCLHFQIDKALDLADKKKFNEVSKQWIETKKLSGKLSDSNKTAEVSL